MGPDVIGAAGEFGAWSGMDDEKRFNKAIAVIVVIRVIDDWIGGPNGVLSQSLGVLGISAAPIRRRRRNKLRLGHRHPTDAAGQIHRNDVQGAIGNFAEIIADRTRTRAKSIVSK